MRNLLAVVPTSHNEMIAATVRTVFAQPDPEATRQQLRQVVPMLETRYPNAAQLLQETEHDVTAYAHFPRARWRKISFTTDLPTAVLDEESREIRLQVDHREDLVAERTRCINRVRRHFHEIDPGWEPKARGLTAYKNLDLAEERLVGNDSVIARIALELIHRIRDLTSWINALAGDLDERTRVRAPRLREIFGVAALSAAKFVGEVAGIGRFRSRHAFAGHNGSAPLPVSSSNNDRHRLSRAGNQQLSAAIHRIALTQARPQPRRPLFIERRTGNGDSRKEAMRALKRRLYDVVFRAMTADIDARQVDQASHQSLAA